MTTKPKFHQKSMAIKVSGLPKAIGEVRMHFDLNDSPYLINEFIAKPWNMGKFH